MSTNAQDLHAMTEVWIIETNAVEDAICVAVKRAQDRAYQLGLARGNVQRDELLAACEKTLAENGHLADGDHCTLIDLKRAVASAKGGA